MKKFIVIICIICLNNCSIIKPVDNKETQYYTFAYFPKKDIPCHMNANRKILQISLTTANTPYNTNNMYYSLQAYTLNHYVYNKWAALPQEIINQSIQTYLTSNCNNTFNIINTNNYLIPNFQLNSQLISLKQEIYNDTSIANLEIKLIIVNPQKNEIIATKTFLINSNANKTPLGFAKATANNLEHFLKDSEDWLTINLKNKIN